MDACERKPGKKTFDDNVLIDGVLIHDGTPKSKRLFLIDLPRHSASTFYFHEECMSIRSKPFLFTFSAFTLKTDTKNLVFIKSYGS